MKSIDPTEFTDPKLMKMISNGDARAWEIILLKYQNIVFAIAKRVLSRQDEVENAFQNTFIKIRMSAKNFRYGETAEKWIKTIAGREALMIRRKTIRQKKESVPMEQIDIPVQVSAAHKLEKKESTRILQQLVEQLPEAIRTPIVLHFASGMNQREISDAMNIDYTVISRQIKKGLDLLRKRLTAAGITDAYMLAPTFIVKALLTETAPEHLVNRLLSMKAQSERIAAATQTSTPLLTKILVSVCAAVAVVVGAMLMRPAVNKPAAVVTPATSIPAAQGSSIPGGYYRKWDFNDGMPRDIEVVQGEWKHVPDDGAEGAGCMEITKNASIFRIPRFADRQLPMRITFYTRSYISKDDKVSLVPSFQCGDFRLAASFNHLNEKFEQIMVWDGEYGYVENSLWLLSTIYADGKRAILINNKQIAGITFFENPGTDLLLVCNDIIRIENLLIETVSPDQIPDISHFERAYKAIDFPEDLDSGTYKVPVRYPDGTTKIHMMNFIWGGRK